MAIAATLHHTSAIFSSILGMSDNGTKTTSVRSTWFTTEALSKATMKALLIHYLQGAHAESSQSTGTGQSFTLQLWELGPQAAPPFFGCVRTVLVWVPGPQLSEQPDQDDYKPTD